MRFPAEQEYLDERVAVVRTMEALEPDAFEHGDTLCEGWAPRDVLGHLLGLDSQMPEYLKHFGNISKANQAIVDHLRSLSRDELLERAHDWSTSPAPLIRPAAWYLLGDLAMHHQDVLRGQGRNRVINSAVRDALLREASVLGLGRLTRYRIEPNDGGRARGRGRRVEGTSEALSMWLAGRKGLADELDFAS